MIHRSVLEEDLVQNRSYLCNFIETVTRKCDRRISSKVELK